MRILFMGTPEFAAVSLKSLLQTNHEVIGVVTQPDRPKGRGMNLQPSEVKLVALERGLTIWQPNKISTPEFIDFFRTLLPDLVVVVAFGQKVPPAILFEPKFGCINVHGSLLPKYRGAAPIQWSLLNGDPVTGITTMYMDEGWDTGDIILQRQLTIGPDENFASLYSRLAELGGLLLVETIESLESGKAPHQPQDHQQATLAPKIKPEQYQINWGSTAESIHNLVRALAPLPGAETFLNNERLKIIETTRWDEAAYPENNCGPGGILGLFKNKGLLVATGDKPIYISKMQPAGKRVMTAKECANGRCLKEGMYFCR